jgi:hypothetical protein
MGYLKTLEVEIRSRHENGETPMDIARSLYIRGIRSPYLPDGRQRDHEKSIGLAIRHLLRLSKVQRPSLDRLEKRVKYFEEQLEAARFFLAEKRRIGKRVKD